MRKANDVPSYLYITVYYNKKWQYITEGSLSYECEDMQEAINIMFNNFTTVILLLIQPTRNPNWLPHRHLSL